MFCRRIYTKLLFNEKNRDLITQDYVLANFNSSTFRCMFY